MSVSISWYDEAHRAIFQRYEAKWTWDDLLHASEETRTLAESVPYNVILFIDMSQGNQLPQGNILAHGRSAFNTMSPNITHLIVAMESRLFKTFAELTLKMLPQWRDRVRLVDTFEKGQRLVEEVIAENALSN